MINVTNKQLITLFLLCMAVYLLSYFSLFVIDDFYYRDDHLVLGKLFTSHKRIFFNLVRPIRHYFEMLFTFNLHPKVNFDYSPVPQILCLVMLTISGLIVLRLFVKKVHWIYVAPLCFFGLFPLFWSNIYYTFFAFIMGFSVLCACLPFIWIEKTKTFIVISFISLFFVLFSYQISLAIYPIIVIFYVLDLWIIKNDLQRAIRIAVISFVVFMIVIGLYYLFFHNTIQVNEAYFEMKHKEQNYVINFINAFQYVFFYLINPKTGLYWLVFGLIILFFSSFLLSIKNNISTIIFAIPITLIALTTTVVLAMFIPTIFTKYGVNRYYVPVNFLIMLLGIYTLSLAQKIPYIKQITTVWVFLMVLHLMMATSAAGNSTQEQWKYEKYRLTLAIGDTINHIEDQNNYKITFSGTNIRQMLVKNLKHRQQLYYDKHSFRPSISYIGDIFIFNRYIPTEKGKPQCTGEKTELVNNIFHSVSKQGDCYEVRFNDIYKKQIN